MSKIFMAIGYFIMVFIVLSNYINIVLSNGRIILLGVLSAVFMCIGIIIKDKKVINVD